MLGAETVLVTKRRDRTGHQPHPTPEVPNADAQRPVRGPEPLRLRISVAVEVCSARSTLRRTAGIAAVVGLVLTGINEGDALFRGDFSAGLGIRIAFNFVVPLIVSNLGVLAGAGRG